MWCCKQSSNSNCEPYQDLPSVNMTALPNGMPCVWGSCDEVCKDCLLLMGKWGGGGGATKWENCMSETFYMPLPPPKTGRNLLCPTLRIDTCNELSFHGILF